MTDVVAGRFALCDPIARGGSGTVWRAYDRKQQRFCAAKVLRRRDAGDLLRFVREQSVRLEHPNVLTPYSWAAEDAHVVIASELVDGGSLSTLIGDYGALDAPTTAAVLDQLLQALEHVHEAGLVHRDVKPANLLLRATGDGPLRVMLSDFGLAVGDEDARLTEVGFVMGTPGYVAPELLRGGVAPDARHDLYAAGRVAAALLAGSEGTGLSSAPETLPPGALANTVHALCAIDPQRRPATAGAARELLGPVRDDLAPRTGGGEPVEVLHQLPPLSDEALTEAGAGETQRLSTETSPLPVESGTRRRRPWLLAGAGLVLAAAIGVPLGIGLTGDGGTPKPSNSPSRSGGSTAPSGSSASSGASSSSSTATGSLVRAGSSCTFVDQNDTADAVGGGSVVCTRQADGRYVWKKQT